MSLDARFELRIDGSRVLEIHAHPQTHPDAIADMLQDAVFSLRNGLALMTAGADLNTSNSDNPPPVEWLYFNYDPQVPKADPATDDDTLSSGDAYRDLQESTSSKDFYGEQPLVGEATYTINGIPAVRINYHPALEMGALARILQDAAKDRLEELDSRQPVQYDSRTVSLTVPATRVGQHILNQLNSYIAKFETALMVEDQEAAEKFWTMSEKFYEWICRNFTPEAIKNSPELQQSRHIAPFKGIKLVPLNKEETTP